jgi:hypothetical protein
MDDCILWTDHIGSLGYGRIYVGGGKYVYAHRVAYEEQIGPIPEGMVIDHLCRVRCCVNVAHLEVVTNQENIMRGNGIMARNARKTRCDQGHPFDEGNTIARPEGRACRICARYAAERYRKRVSV